MDNELSDVLSDVRFIAKLRRIRIDWEQRTGLPLNTTNPSLTISCFLGAHDIKAHNKQISFLDKMVIGLSPYLPSPSNQALNPQNYIDALRVLVVVCFYTKASINKKYHIRSAKSSNLGALLDDALELAVLTPEAESCCLLATQRFLNKTNQFENLNACLTTKIPENQWLDFTNFVSAQCQLLDKKYLTDYPITSVLMPVVAGSFEIVGYTTGFILGDLVSHSTNLRPARYALTAVLSSGLVLINPGTATVGAVLIAPTIAGHLLDTYCGLSLASIMSGAMKLVGNGVGFGVGIPLDLGWKLIASACSLIAQYKSTNTACQTGISLVDGTRYIEGIPLNVMPAHELPENYSYSLHEATTLRTEPAELVEILAQQAPLTETIAPAYPLEDQTNTHTGLELSIK